jgi:hypothetical protein
MSCCGVEIKRRKVGWGDAITEDKRGRLSFLATQDKLEKNGVKKTGFTSM